LIFGCVQVGQGLLIVPHVFVVVVVVVNKLKEGLMSKLIGYLKVHGAIIVGIFQLPNPI
jgi:hypothetical protein